MEYKNGHIDFHNLTVCELMELNDITNLVVNGFIFFPNTYISDLKESELQVLFGKDAFEDVVKKYQYENIGAVKYDIRQRLKQYVRNECCVMHINKAYVRIWTRDSIQHIERTNFDSAIRAITGSEIIV